MYFGSESEFLGLGNQAFAVRKNSKTYFHRSCVSHDSRVHFLKKSNGIGANFHNFCCLADEPEILRLLNVILRSSQILRPGLLDGSAVVFGFDSKTIKAETSVSYSSGT